MKKILVPIDGSECSLKALDRAKEIGINSNSEILIITVVDTLKDDRLITNQEFKLKKRAESISRGNKILDDAMEIMISYPFKVKKLIKDGDIVREIINTATVEGVDLIIIGSRGLGALSRTFLGSVSSQVVNHSKVSVFVVK